MPYFLLGGLIFFVIAFLFQKYWILVGALFCMGFAYGQYRNALTFEGDQTVNFHNRSVGIVGFVDSFPDIREKSNRVFVRVLGLDISDSDKKKGGLYEDIGRVLLVYPVDIDLDYGDRLYFYGTFKRPRNFDGFDYQKYLKRFGVQSIMQNPKKIEVIIKGRDGNGFILKAKKVRNYLADNLTKALPSPHNEIAMGILLGVKKELPEVVGTHFKNSGLQHILVVSGFNVTILMVFIALVLRRFGRRIVFFGSGIGLFFFTMMVGADPPVLRAAIFGAIVGWAVVSGRFSDSRNLLFLTAVILALYSPLMVQTDVGFFLSFFATLGIILGLPIGQKFFDFLPNRFELRAILSVIIFAQLAVFPILSLYFGTFPVVGFFANILVEPLIPLGMFFAFFVAIIPLGLFDLASIWALPALFILELIITIATFFGGFTPLEVPRGASVVSLILILIFFVWGSFSVFYQHRFLEEGSRGK